MNNVRFKDMSFLNDRVLEKEFNNINCFSFGHFESLNRQGKQIKKYRGKETLVLSKLILTY
jgi:hypothetical protein